jgi:succinate dehydrogenase/fumarate reductase flavoprotein subunit
MTNRPDADPVVSRRSFLTKTVTGVTGGALAGIAGSGLSVAQASAQAPPIQEMRADVVAVGSGMGGLTAALRAQKGGARVIVLEKASELGGTTAHSGGHVLRHTYDNMRAHAPDGDPDVQRTVAENYDKWSQFMDAIDAPIGPLGPVPGTNNEVSFRMIASVIWVRFMVSMIESGGGKVFVETPMIRLLVNYQNEVVGLLADTPRGVIRILAKAVVLATGGWMTNAALIQQSITRYFGSLRQGNASGFGKPPFLGDGLFAALGVGAQPSAGAFDCFYGYLMPARPGKVEESMLNSQANFAQWVVAVNRFGRRFTDEAQGRWAGRKITNQGGEFCAQEVARQPDAMAAYIYDDFVSKRYACDNCAAGGISTYARYKMSGAPTAMANTLPELTRQMEDWGIGMSAETVLHELTEYNRAVKNGKTWALPVPKMSAKHAPVLEKPPFYAILGQAGLTATQGGIRVNTMGQVLHRSGKPIPGLYAAGVDIGDFSNYAYLGNLNLGAAYGYVSGKNAAKQPAPRGGWDVAP